LVDVHLVDRGVQLGGDELGVHGRGAVAELRRADRQGAIAVGIRRDGCLGEVTARRDDRDHRDRHALADPPLPTVGRRHPVARRQRMLGQVQTLVEPVAAERQVVVCHV
jgi:hypothetical protein